MLSATPGTLAPRAGTRVASGGVADAHYENPRLAMLYDPLDHDRSDLEVYAAMAAQFGARAVLDIGCGTGVLACLLACRGYAVTGLDPALASLEVARRKPFADRVRWIHGTVDALPDDLEVDLVTMTGNVAQVFLTDTDLADVMNAAHRVLRPGGRLVFETRDPARRAWREWDRAHSYVETDIPGAGGIAGWHEVTGVTGELVTFRATYVFASDGAVLTSESTLRFRSKTAIEAALAAAGFTVEEIRDAPDRPGKEFVFIACRSRFSPSSARVALP
jgi:SAM-dependent methyltransferase